MATRFRDWTALFGRLGTQTRGSTLGVVGRQRCARRLIESSSTLAPVPWARRRGQAWFLGAAGEAGDPELDRPVLAAVVALAFEAKGLRRLVACSARGCDQQ